MKIQTSKTFPAFTTEDRKDVSSYFEEFDRIARHVGDGRLMNDDEYCGLLIDSCERASLAGKKLRSVQKSAVYKTLEGKMDFEGCKVLLVNALKSLQRNEYLTTKDAKMKYDSLRYRVGGDVVLFHTELDEALEELDRQGYPKDEKTLWLDYQEKMEDKTALGSVIRQSKPTTVDDLRSHLEEYYAIEEGLEVDKGPKVK